MNMQQSKHTPGPWEVHARSVMPQVRAGQVSIADICWNGHNETHGDANARLIAAAPEMLASERDNLTALENLLAYLRKHEAALPPVSTSSLEVRIEKTRALIAKAEG